MPNTESYSWTPPASAISDTCRLRITDPNNSATTTESAANFTIATKTKVSKPDINSSWGANESYHIQWQKWGDFAYVNIYYSSNDGVDWVVVDADVPNKPSHGGDGLNGINNWTIPAETILSPNARIKVIDAGDETYALALISAKFTTKGSVDVLWPNTTDHAIYQSGKTTEEIKLARYGNIAGVKVFDRPTESATCQCSKAIP